MTLNSSGPISIGGPTVGQSIELELTMSGTAQASLNDSNFRTLAGVPSGQISMSDFYGKSARVTINLTVSSNTSNYNIRTAAGNPVAPADVTLTINSGVFVYSNINSLYALDTGIGWAAGSTITIINNGKVIGAAGSGAYSSSNGVPGNATYGANGGDGGPALNAQYPVTITNNDIFAGGGGGGGSGSNIDGSVGAGIPSNYGGNGNGGTGVTFPSSGGNAAGVSNSAILDSEGFSSATAGGAYGNTNGTDGVYGGSYMPLGFTGTSTSGGGGSGQASSGGGGAGLGASGGTGNSVYNARYGFSTTSGGWPGSYAIGNGNITWNVTGSRYGRVDNKFSSGHAVRLQQPVEIVAVSSGTPSTVTATITFNADGTISGTTAGFASHTFADNWYKPTTSSIGNSYWIRATVATGTNLTSPSSGTTGTWLQLSSARAWSNTISSVTNKQTRLNIDIASDSLGSNIVASGIYYLKVYRSA